MPLSVLGVFFFVQSYGYSRGAGVDPPSYLIAISAIALLYMVAFAGSEFEGRLDQAVGALAR